MITSRTVTITGMSRAGPSRKREQGDKTESARYSGRCEVSRSTLGLLALYKAAGPFGLSRSSYSIQQAPKGILLIITLPQIVFAVYPASPSTRPREPTPGNKRGRCLARVQVLLLLLPLLCCYCYCDCDCYYWFRSPCYCRCYSCFFLPLSAAALGSGSY